MPFSVFASCFSFLVPLGCNWRNENSLIIFIIAYHPIFIIQKEIGFTNRFLSQKMLMLLELVSCLFNMPRKESTDYSNEKVNVVGTKKKGIGLSWLINKLGSLLPTISFLFILKKLSSKKAQVTTWIEKRSVALQECLIGVLWSSQGIL